MGGQGPGSKQKSSLDASNVERFEDMSKLGELKLESDQIT